LLPEVVLRRINKGITADEEQQLFPIGETVYKLPLNNKSKSGDAIGFSAMLTARLTLFNLV